MACGEVQYGGVPAAKTAQYQKHQSGHGSLDKILYLSGSITNAPLYDRWGLAAVNLTLMFASQATVYIHFTSVLTVKACLVR